MKRSSRYGMKWLEDLNKWDYRAIELVQIVYEDCDHCGDSANCPDIRRMSGDLAAVKFFKRMFRRHKVPVTLHKKNSGNNARTLVKSIIPGAPLPLEMNMQYDGSALYMLAYPHYNYFIVRYKDKSEKLYTINMSFKEKKKVEAVSCPMYR